MLTAGREEGADPVAGHSFRAAVAESAGLSAVGQHRATEVDPDQLAMSDLPFAVGAAWSLLLHCGASR